MIRLAFVTSLQLLLGCCFAAGRHCDSPGVRYLAVVMRALGFAWRSFLSLVLRLAGIGCCYAFVTWLLFCRWRVLGFARRSLPGCRLAAGGHWGSAGVRYLAVVLRLARIGIRQAFVT